MAAARRSPPPAHSTRPGQSAAWVGTSKSGRVGCGGRGGGEVPAAPAMHGCPALRGGGSPSAAAAAAAAVPTLPPAHLLRLADACRLDDQVVKAPLPRQLGYLLLIRRNTILSAGKSGCLHGGASVCRVHSWTAIAASTACPQRACSRSSRSVQQMQPFCISTSRSWVCRAGQGRVVGAGTWQRQEGTQAATPPVARWYGWLLAAGHVPSE